MPDVSCPHCGLKQNVPADWLGTEVECPGCRAGFEAHDGYGPRIASRRPRRANGAVPPPVRWGAIGAAAGAAISLPVSQFTPVFGGILAAIGDPFTPARLSQIPIHLFGFGLTGLALGVGAYFLWGAYGMADRRPVAVDRPDPAVLPRRRRRPRRGNGGPYLVLGGLVLAVVVVAWIAAATAWKRKREAEQPAVVPVGRR